MTDLHAPIFRVTVKDPDGRIVPLRSSSGEGSEIAGAILSVEWEDVDEGHSSFRLTLENNDLRLFDSPLVSAGNRVTFQLGYPDLLIPLLTYTIKSLEGGEVLTIGSEDEAIALSETQKSRVFENKTPPDIARAIAAEAGFTDPIIEDGGEIREAVQQSNESDAVLLQRLAEGLDFIFKIQGSRFLFHPRRLSEKPVKSFTWSRSGDVLDFSFDADFLNLAGEFVARGINPDTGQIFEERVTIEDSEKPSLGPKSMTTYSRSLNDFVLVDEEAGESGPVVSTTAPTKEEAKEEALAVLTDTDRKQVTAELTVVGDPLIRAGVLVELRNFSKLLSGNYYVKEVLHVISQGGYTTTMQLERNAVGLTESTEKIDQELSNVNEKEAPLEPEEVIEEFTFIDPDTGTVKAVQALR